jgi:hypothetical protein
MVTNKTYMHIIVEHLQGKKQLGSPRCRWENDIKADLRVIVCDSVDWIELALGQRSVVGSSLEGYVYLRVL